MSDMSEDMDPRQPETGEGQIEIRSSRSSRVSERLKNEKLTLEARLVKVNEAIRLLEASPDVKAAMDAISELGGIGGMRL